MKFFRKPTSEVDSRPSESDMGCCPICYEQFEDEVISVENQTYSKESRCIRSVLPCGHEFCEHCLRSHSTSVISTKTAQLQCPEIDCSEPIPEVLQRSLLSPLEWKKLRKLKKLEKQPSLLECPYCNDLTRGQDEKNDIVCSV